MIEGGNFFNKARARLAGILAGPTPSPEFEAVIERLRSGTIPPESEHFGTLPGGYHETQVYKRLEDGREIGFYDVVTSHTTFAYPIELNSDNHLHVGKPILIENGAHKR